MLMQFLCAFIAVAVTAADAWAQRAEAPAPFAAASLEIGSAGLWWRTDAVVEPDTGGRVDTSPWLGASVLAGLAMGRSVRVAALGHAFWHPYEGDAPQLVALAGIHLEYIFPPGAYYVLGEAGPCWHVLSPWDSPSSAGPAVGFALGTGFRFTPWLSLEARFSYSGYELGGDDDPRYRHIAILAALRAALPGR